MKAMMFVMLLSGCSTPKQKCEKFFSDFQRKTENCGINAPMTDVCGTDPGKKLAEAKPILGPVLEAETCPAVKVHWERAMETMMGGMQDKIKSEIERRLANDPDGSFRRAYEEANKTQ